MATETSATLESSLTAMDWLHRINVGKNKGLQGPSGNEMDDEKKGHPSGHDGSKNGANGPDGKPPYSYANLIMLAINSSKSKMMTLSEIYQWICDNFSYYRDAGNGWKVSIDEIDIENRQHHVGGN